MDTHIPVLGEEVLALLRPEKGGAFIDATLGMGGHSQLLFQRAQKAKVSFRLIGIDQDEESLTQAKKRLGKNLEYVQANFSQLADVAKARGIASAQGILMDLGVSSYQLSDPDRGFSFQQEGYLDMRLDKSDRLTAADLVNNWPEPKLADLFFRLGEERQSKKIARLICQEREKKALTSTRQLEELIFFAYPPALRHKRLHPATKVFQALRLEVNQELPSLESGLQAALSLLASGGRLVVISFHSLEDRIVKQAFKEAVSGGKYLSLTKKPITPSEEEVLVNPRARSAKMRALEKI